MSMKIQRLSALDIIYLASDLDKELKHQTIRDIVFQPDNLYIGTAKLIIRYAIISGAPYIMYADKLPQARHRLHIIEGGVIESVDQVRGDRLIRFTIAVYDRLGKKKYYFLYLEFYKNGNIVLTNAENFVMSSLRRSESSGNIYQQAEAGGPKALEWLLKGDLNLESLELIREMNILPWSGYLVSGQPDISGLQSQINSCPAPHIIKDKENRPLGFTIYGPPYIKDITAIKMANLASAIRLYVDSYETGRKAKGPDYQKQIKKAQKKLDALNEELADARKYRQYRQYGELLLANLTSIRKGQAEFLIDTIYNEKPASISIPLNPALSPSQNAKEYFDKARKAESGLKIIESRIESQSLEIAKLETLANEAAQGILPEKPVETRQKPKSRKLPFRQFQLSGGWQIFVGKSAKTNDELTFSFARKDDLWFHAWQAFGSHLILRAPEKGMKPDKNLLMTAAALAAYYSKAKNSSKVPIIYTEVRYIRKVKKVPGKVTYTNEKELMVEPQSPEDLFR